MNLLVFGIGYSAGYFLDHHAQAFDRIAGTVRRRDKAAALAAKGVEAFVFDDATADPGLSAAIEGADAILVSVQPAATGDAVLQHFGPAIAGAARWRRLVYLSTIGVYGDHGGAWIDEATRPAPENARGKARLEVEAAYLALGRPAGPLSERQVAVLRLAGIYGPGRNAIADLREGVARRIDKPGQVFNRIHVEDIGRTIAAAFAAEAPQGVWNVTDDEPAPAPDVVAYGAALLGLAPPPLIPFEEAELSPMARSFYGANRRVSNAAIKRDLNVTLAYPTYREGLDALGFPRQ
jgi:nucleoside-diphosphate-sugar epimerase